MGNTVTDVQVRQKVALEVGIPAEELESDSEELAAALEYRKQYHKRRHAAASILQVSFLASITAE